MWETAMGTIREEENLPRGELPSYDAGEAPACGMMSEVSN